MNQISRATAEKIKTLATDDYQNRDGNYPDSDIPDMISVWEDQTNGHLEVRAEFKNTDERTAANWLAKYLSKTTPTSLDHITACQTGDYQDDWVNATTWFQIEK